MQELFFPLDFWNYIFRPMRMTDAILPGYTSPGTIKGSANHARPLFPFPPCWQQGKTSRHGREHFSLSPPGRFQQQTEGPFHLERAHFNICSSASFRRPFPGQLFLPPKPNGSRSIWLSTKFPAQPLTADYLLRLTAQGKIFSLAVIKLQNWNPWISTSSLFIFFLLILQEATERYNVNCHLCLNGNIIDLLVI